jgi:hypothetical protein
MLYISLNISNTAEKAFKTRGITIVEMNCRFMKFLLNRKPQGKNVTDGNMRHYTMVPFMHHEIIFRTKCKLEIDVKIIYSITTTIHFVEQPQLEFS